MMFDDMRALLDRIGPPVDRRMRVGTAILGWIRDLPRRQIRAGDDLAATLFGVPLILDLHLHAGAWEFIEDGEVILSGQVGEPDRPLWYVPGRGFLIGGGPVDAQTPEEAEAGRLLAERLNREQW